MRLIASRWGEYGRVVGEGMLERRRGCFHGVRYGGRALDVWFFVGGEELVGIAVWQGLFHILVGFHLIRFDVFLLVVNLVDLDSLEWFRWEVFWDKISGRNTELCFFLKYVEYYVYNFGARLDRRVRAHVINFRVGKF